MAKILNELGLKRLEEKRVRRALRAKRADIAARGLLSKAMREAWADPDFRVAMLKAQKAAKNVAK